MCLAALQAGDAVNDVDSRPWSHCKRMYEVGMCAEPDPFAYGELI